MMFVAATPAASAAINRATQIPSVRRLVIRGLHVENVHSDGSLVPWPQVGRAELPADLVSVSIAIRHLSAQGMATDGPRLTGLGVADVHKRYAIVGDLIIVCDKPVAGGTRVGVFVHPDSSDFEGFEKGRALIEAIEADIRGSQPDLSGLTV